MRRWRKAAPEQAPEPEATGTLRITITYDGMSLPVAEGLEHTLPRLLGKAGGWNTVEMILKQRVTQYGEIIDMADPPLEMEMKATSGADTTAAAMIAQAELKRMRRWLKIDDNIA